MRFFNTLALFCLCGLVPFISSCAVNPVTGRSELAFYEMSEAREIEMGRKAFPEAVQKMHGEFKDPVLLAYVNQVGKKLGQVSHRPHLSYRFKVVNDSSPNAFALPGGFIAVTRGLLVNLENEAQLAAVLGHEVGHVTARHAAQGLQRNILLNVGLAVLSETTGEASYSAVARQGGQLAAVLIENSYSREQEREADRLGIDYMVRAGYNPLGAVQLQEFFLKQSEGERNPLWLEGLFRTHPFSRDRMRANQAYIQSRYPRTVKSSAYVLAPEPFQGATAKLRETKKAYDLYDRATKEKSKGNLDGAIDLYRQAVRAAPDQALLHTALGRALLGKGDLDAARPQFEKAIRLDDGYFEPHQALGYILLKSKEYDHAVAELKRSMDLSPTLEGAFYLAEASEKVGDWRQALQLYKQVAAADPRGAVGRAAAARARALGGGTR